MALPSLLQDGDQLPQQGGAAPVRGCGVGLLPARRQRGGEGQEVSEREAPGRQRRAATSSGVSGQVPGVSPAIKEPWKTQKYHTKPLLFWLF